MRAKLNNLYLIAFCINNLYLIVLSPGCRAVIMETTDQESLYPENPESFNEAFGSCLARNEYGTFECANRGALSVLQSLSQKQELEYGEVRLRRADEHGRELLDWNYDPKDFGNIVKAAARLMERRSLSWNLDRLYPGLQLRAGPMLDGNGVLEFVINERASGYGDRQQAGAGRQLAKHLLLPFLLGFKFNLASLIPLLFGFLVLVTKKALLLTKVALFLSGLLGWNSLFSLASNQQTFHGFNGVHGFVNDPSIGFPYADHHQHFGHRPYRGLQADFPSYGQHVIREVVNVYENDDNLDSSKRSGKNFAWTKDD